MKVSQTPVTPVKQAMVKIAGHNILAVVFDDNSIGAGVRMICDLLGVHHIAQLRKIRADRAIHDKLILATVQTAGGPHETNVIIAEAIPIWLKGIEPSRVSPEARQTLMEFQRVAVDALRTFFFPEAKAQPSAPPKQKPAQALPPKEEPKQSAPPKQEPEPATLPPSEEEDEMAYWEEMSGGMIGLEKQLRRFYAFQKRTEGQMVRVQQYFQEDAVALNQHEERLNALAAQVKHQGEQLGTLTELVNRLMTPGSLTAEHQGELRARLRAVAHQARQPVSAIERELAAACGVETISQLPEARWGEIAAWFQQRLGW